MSIKKFNILYLFVSILIIIAIRFLFKINNYILFFNLCLFLIFLFLFIKIFRNNFKKIELISTKLFGAWILFSAVSAIIYPQILLYFIGFFIILYTYKIIFNSESYKSFGRKIQNIPMYLSLIMILITGFYGDISNILFIFIGILILIYVYKKDKKNKTLIK
ncbi:hypothetical protein SDC9_08492 [bioreactor metagenome]|uniref:Uncharacterized protein n=1 Tax=bioreactor metagenome TaxID=1076179 RepID=A0A644T9P5_9ZZZZ